MVHLYGFSPVDENEDIVYNDVTLGYAHISMPRSPAGGEVLASDNRIDMLSGE